MEKDIYVNELNAIMRTRLIFNTNEELDEFIGFDFTHGNNARKKGAAARIMAFYKLDKKVSQMWGAPLDRILAGYKFASDFANEPNVCIYKNNFKEIFDDFDNAIKGNIREDLYGKLNFPIFVLIMIGVLPNYNTNKGSVKNILDDFYKVADFFYQYSLRMENSCMYHPVINKYKSYVAKNGVGCLSRLFLIRMSVDIVMQYCRIYSSFTACPVDNVNFLKKNIDGIWLKSEEDNPNDFFQISKADYDYHYALSHFVNRHGSISVDFYTFSFNNYGNSVLMVINDLSFIRKMIANDHPDNFYGSYTVAFSMQPTKIHNHGDNIFRTLSFSDENNGRLVLDLEKLYKTSNNTIYLENIRLAKQCIDWKRIPKFSSLFYAITVDNIYFKLSDEDIDLLRNFYNIGSERYLRIPRQCSVVSNISQITPTLLLLKYADNKLYLWNGETFRYVDLTDRQRVSDLGISFEVGLL